MADLKIHTRQSSDNWKPGDLAMAICSGVAIQAGCIYVVKCVIPTAGFWSNNGRPDGTGPGLVLNGVWNPANPITGKVWHGHFMKATPQKRDKFDRETIKLMKEKLAPAKVSLNGGAA